MPKFSIIIPVYNVEKDIKQCLDSIINQTFSDFEAIFIDDCGTDNSIKIVEEYAKNDSRFVIIHHEHNQGVSVARNTGLDAMKGEYLVFVDPDDYLELNALEVMDNAFSISGREAVFFGHNNVTDDKVTPNDDSRMTSRNFYVNANSLSHLVGVIWNKAYKASIIQDNNIRFPKDLIVEDSEFTFKVFCHIKEYSYLQETLYNYRKNREGSLTTEDNKTFERICDEFQILNNCYDYMNEKNIDKFKPYIVKDLGSKIKKILFIKHRREYILREADKLMQKMNFPQDYEFMEQRRIFKMK